MSADLITPRLRLKSLSMEQLRLSFNDRKALERELGFPISEGIIEANVPRAINIKLGKMDATDPLLHDWLTYWLVIVKEARIGVGLIGFKGVPDEAGSVEVGYGIDALFQNKGYMTEALAALCEWAFSQAECRRVTATTVVNPASERLLQKSGFRLTAKDDRSTSWELPKPRG